jgi:hypothetical protein
MSEEDFEFGERLPGRDRDIAPERWLRVKEEIVFRDLVQEMLSKHGKWKINGNAISCPFHGKDSTPSFNFYEGSNSAFCFGCPPPVQNQTYDAVSFVAKFYEISPSKALQWIEKHYKLPFIAGQIHEEEDEEDEEPDSFYTVDDLAPLYLSVAPKLIESVEDAKQLLRTYFLALREDDPLFLARVLGRQRLASIKSGGSSTDGSERRSKRS